VEVDYTKENLAFDQYLVKRKEEGEEGLSKIEEELHKMGRYKPAMYTAFISYDAPNAYGTLIRGIARCSYLSIEGGVDDLSRYSIKVNGKSSLERLKEVL
jgi:hypothetical protein